MSFTIEFLSYHFHCFYFSSKVYLFKLYKIKVQFLCINIAYRVATSTFDFQMLFLGLIKEVKTDFYGRKTKAWVHINTVYQNITLFVVKKWSLLSFLIAVFWMTHVCYFIFWVVCVFIIWQLNLGCICFYYLTMKK